MEKVIRNGKVAVLISADYGAGWSTWNDNDCLFTPEIVELVLAEADTDLIQEAATRLYGSGFYTGGASGLTIEWVPEGQKFIVNEYDGYESITLLSNIKGVEA